MPHAAKLETCPIHNDLEILALFTRSSSIPKETTPRLNTERDGRSKPLFLGIIGLTFEIYMYVRSTTNYQAYLQAAALHLWQSSGDPTGVSSISGIWVSSDDSSVLAEVQALAPRYFPNVTSASVTTISFRIRSPGKYNGQDELPTTSRFMVR